MRFSALKWSMNNSFPCACRRCRMACRLRVPPARVCFRVAQWHLMQLFVSFWFVHCRKTLQCTIGGAIYSPPAQTVLFCVSIRHRPFATDSMVATHLVLGQSAGQRCAHGDSVSSDETATCDRGSCRNSRNFMGLHLHRRRQLFCINCWLQSTDWCRACMLRSQRQFADRQSFLS